MMYMMRKLYRYTTFVVIDTMYSHFTGIEPVRCFIGIRISWMKLISFFVAFQIIVLIITAIKISKIVINKQGDNK